MILLFLPRKLQSKLKQKRTILWLFDLLAGLSLACIGFAVGFKVTENVSWEEAFWQVWQTITTVGYGNRPAQTSAGRWVTMVFGVIGIALLGTTISAYFSWREESRTRRRMGLTPNPYKNGYVFFHFPGEAKLLGVISQLRAAEEDIPICVVSHTIEELPTSIACLPNMHFVKGSMLNKATYEQANLQYSKAVVIYPQQSGVDESDAITKVVVELAEQFIGQQTRLIHFLINPDNAWMFKDNRSHPILEHLEMFALVQECQDKGTASLVQRLLLNTSGVNPETVTPRQSVGWTWYDLQFSTLQASRNLKIPVSIFALIRDGIPDPCPDPETVIRDSDTISLIAHTHLDWNQFETEMTARKRQNP